MLHSFKHYMYYSNSTPEYAPENVFNLYIYVYFINYLPKHANRMNII